MSFKLINYLRNQNRPSNNVGIVCVAKLNILCRPCAPHKFYNPYCKQIYMLLFSIKYRKLSNNNTLKRTHSSKMRLRSLCAQYLSIYVGADNILYFVLNWNTNILGFPTGISIGTYYIQYNVFNIFTAGIHSKRNTHYYNHNERISLLLISIYIYIRNICLWTYQSLLLCICFM